ncbi:MAG: Hsp70 family protein, partial [Myxococcales bacterium]|nr:Hsp70 family protein [Myxococcales bacterium]
KDKATSKETKITITANSGLNENEINKMVEDAQQFEEEDKKRREAVENRNALEAMVLQTEKLLSENGDKLPETERGEVQSAIEDAKSAIESGDNDRIVEAREKLTQASHKMAQAMYGQPGAQPPPGADGAPGAPHEEASQDSGGDDGDVIDAEFEEKN